MNWFKKKPTQFSLLLREIGKTIEVRSDETLLQAALDRGIALPHLCRVGSCGSCKCKLESGMTKSLVDLSYVLSPEEIRLGFILPCQALPRSDCELSALSLAVQAQQYDDLDSIVWPEDN